MAQETAGRLDIAELKRLHAAATQGEYFLLGDKHGTPRKRRLCSDMEQVYEVSSPGQCFWVGLFVSSADAQSFSALHNAFPALIARLETAEAKVDEQEAQIEALELDGGEYEKDCKKALVSLASAFNYEWDGDGATADELREFIQETVRVAQAMAAAMQWRPIEEAHEDWGVCVFINIHEPEPICASTMDDDFAETAKHYGWTHFLRITLTNEDAAALLAALPAPPEATR